MKVFVAGATGVLGSAAVPRLLASGHEVAAIARSPEKAAALEQLGASPVAVDLFDSAAVALALRRHDCEAVINLATHIPTGAAALTRRGWAMNDRIRTAGSAALVDAALAGGVRRFIQEGVSFVYADGGDDWIDEDSPVDAAGRTGSVLAAAAQARRFATGGSSGVGSGAQARDSVVLWFGMFYGDDPLTRANLDLARRGLPAVLGAPDSWATFVQIQDAGAAVVAALAVPSGTYNVGDTPIRRSEQAAALAEATGRGQVRLAGPLMVRLGGPSAGVLARSHRVSSRRFRDASGWAPVHATFTEGLRATHPV